MTETPGVRQRGLQEPCEAVDLVTDLQESVLESSDTDQREQEADVLALAIIRF